MKDTTPIIPSSLASPTTETSNGIPSSWILAHVFCFWLSVVIIKSFWDFEDAPRALAVYGIYHQYGWNQFIHFFGVPGIVWSLLILMVHVPLPFVPKKHKKSINYGSFMALCYAAFYLSLDAFAGTLYMPFLYAMYASAVHMRNQDHGALSTTAWYGTGRGLKFALALHVFCWYVQIHPGHKIIEGAAPAIVGAAGSLVVPGSFGGVLSVAPFFAFYEGLWFVGINRELQNSTLTLIEGYTRQLCLEQGTSFMKACQSLS